MNKKIELGKRLVFLRDMPNKKLLRNDCDFNFEGTYREIFTKLRNLSKIFHPDKTKEARIK